MLALLGLLIVTAFMVLIMSKKASPFIALVLSPIIVALGAGLLGLGGIEPDKITKFAMAGIVGNQELGIKGVSGTAVMLLFAILYFGLMLSAGLFSPLSNWIIKQVKGDPLKVLVGTAILALFVSVDGDGSTTTLVVCSAMIPIYKRLNMRMMDLAVLVILANSIMNLLPWGGPTARIITALHIDEGALLRAILPGMVLASIWVVAVAVMRGKAERKRLGIANLSDADIQQMLAKTDEEDEVLARPKLLWLNFTLTLDLMILLVFGGTWIIPKISSALIFLVGIAIAFIVNYPRQSEQRLIIEKYGSSAVQVIFMVLAAGVFMGILSGTGMSNAMGESLANLVPASFGSHWPLVVAIVSVPGTFLLSNDAFYLGVLPVLNQVGIQYGFTPMSIAIASTAGQAFHLLSPLVGFIYLLLQLTGVDMGKWQIQSAKWGGGIFVLFLVAMFAIGGVPF